MLKKEFKLRKMVIDTTKMDEKDQNSQIWIDAYTKAIEEVANIRTFITSNQDVCSIIINDENTHIENRVALSKLFIYGKLNIDDINILFTQLYSMINTKKMKENEPLLEDFFYLILSLLYNKNADLIVSKIKQSFINYFKDCDYYIMNAILYKLFTKGEFEYNDFEKVKKSFVERFEENAFFDISSNKSCPLEFIERNKDKKINWIIVSKRNDLTDSFILTCKDKLIMKLLIVNDSIEPYRLLRISPEITAEVINASKGNRFTLRDEFLFYAKNIGFINAIEETGYSNKKNLMSIIDSYKDYQDEAYKRYVNTYCI